jgi:hypothetical protein
MPAACGVAADVPKKFGYEVSFWQAVFVVDRSPVDGNGGLSEASVNPRNVVLTPSGPTKSGFWRTTGVLRRVPAVLKRIGAPPSEEYLSSSAGVVPQAGVSK